MSDNGYLLEMNDISVEFPGVKALDKVKFNAKRGEVHVLAVAKFMGYLTVPQENREHTHFGTGLIFFSEGQNKEYFVILVSENAFR